MNGGPFFDVQLPLHRSDVIPNTAPRWDFKRQRAEAVLSVWLDAFGIELFCAFVHRNTMRSFGSSWPEVDADNLPSRQSGSRSEEKEPLLWSS